MFLCIECHATGHSDPDPWTAVVESHTISHGTCEYCGRYGDCFDCHDYDFRLRNIPHD